MKNAAQTFDTGCYAYVDIFTKMRYFLAHSAFNTHVWKVCYFCVYKLFLWNFTLVILYISLLEQLQHLICITCQSVVSVGVAAATTIAF